MGSSPALALSLLILIFTSLHISQAFLIPDPVTVTLVNKIEYGLPVNVHCKSKNDDLGVHTLALGQSYSFKFRPNVFGVTLFYCSFAWVGQHEIYWFDVYNDKRDAGICTTCQWIIHEAGICLQNPKTADHKEICYNYGSKEPASIM